MIELLFLFLPSLEHSYREQTCYERSVYYEGRGEPQLGQHLILQTIRNRINHARDQQTCRSITAAPFQFSGCISLRNCGYKLSPDRVRGTWNALLWRLGFFDREIASLSGQFFFSGGHEPEWGSDKLVLKSEIGGHRFYELRQRVP